MNYYNEFSHKPAAALRQLIEDKLIPNGIVDDRSITEVRPDDLKGFTQCHFFAGIGGWSLALQLAGWEPDRPVWTGSCPCQPFSTAGKRKGKSDERHLWPVWFNLIRECRPSTIFGEQVAAAITHGWMDEVAHDLETEGYTFGAAVLPACSVGAPHKRDRLWFVGNSEHNGLLGGRVTGSNGPAISNYAQRPDCAVKSAGTSQSRNVAFTSSVGWETGGEVFRLLPELCENGPERDHAGRRSASCLLADDSAINGRGQSNANTGGRGDRICAEQRGVSGDNGKSNVAYNDSQRCNWKQISIRQEKKENFKTWWSGEFIECPDGKQRLIEPSIRLLADGFPERVGLLSAAGNAIVPQVAAAFIEAYMSIK